MASPNTKYNKNKEVNDLYNTPIEALEGFYSQYPECFDQYNVFYDPCNGLGKISDFLRSIGKKVYTSDLIDYSTGDDIQDFLELEELPKDVQCIVFNPPFTLTKEFMDHAVKLMDDSSKCLSIIMFNRASTLFSKERGKRFVKNDWPLDCAYLFSYRVSCTKGVNEEPTANSVDYAWYEFNWTKVEYEDTIIKWIL